MRKKTESHVAEFSLGFDSRSGRAYVAPVMRNEFNNRLLDLLLAGNDPVEPVCL